MEMKHLSESIRSIIRESASTFLARRIALMVVVFKLQKNQKSITMDQDNTVLLPSASRTNNIASRHICEVMGSSL